MSRIFVTAVSAVTIILFAIHAMTYRSDALDSQSLNSTEAEALNLTQNVTSDAMLIAGNAMPRLFGAVIIVLVIVFLVLIAR